MSDYTTLTNHAGLSVYVDWSDPTAAVLFSWQDGDEQNTPFQTADFNIGRPEEVLRRVDAYADEMVG
jgi:hypothetical protein